MLVGREKLVAVRAEIRAIDKVGLAKEVREQKLQEAQFISEAVLDASVRIGELMQAVPKATTNHKKKDLENDSGVDFLKPKAEIIKEAGFTPKQVERFQQMAANPELVEQVKAEAKENGDIASQSAVMNKIKEKKQAEKNSKRKADIERQAKEIETKTLEQPDGLFDVIVMDPPWNYGTEYNANGRRVANPYPEMTQEQLKAIELPAADNCVLFLWTTHKFIWDAKELLNHWGFEYRNIIVWDKQQMGMGNLFRMQCEFCLVATKGKPFFTDIHNLRDILYEQRREHSRKPESFYELVDNLCVGRKLDYFSRSKREGWEVFGNDTDKFTVA